jgi:hypothetical protein
MLVACRLAGLSALEGHYAGPQRIPAISPCGATALKRRHVGLGRQREAPQHHPNNARPTLHWRRLQGRDAIRLSCPITGSPRGSEFTVSSRTDGLCSARRRDGGSRAASCGRSMVRRRRAIFLRWPWSRIVDAEVRRIPPTACRLGPQDAQVELIFQTNAQDTNNLQHISTLVF